MLSDLVSIYLHAYFAALFLCLLVHAYREAKGRGWNVFFLVPMVVGTALILLFIHPILTLMAFDKDRKETR